MVNDAPSPQNNFGDSKPNDILEKPYEESKPIPPLPIERRESNLSQDLENSNVEEENFQRQPSYPGIFICLYSIIYIAF